MALFQNIHILFKIFLKKYLESIILVKWKSSLNFVRWIIFFSPSWISSITCIKNICRCYSYYTDVLWSVGWSYIHKTGLFESVLKEAIFRHFWIYFLLGKARNRQVFLFIKHVIDSRFKFLLKAGDLSQNNGKTCQSGRTIGLVYILRFSSWLFRGIHWRGNVWGNTIFFEFSKILIKSWANITFA